MLRRYFDTVSPRLVLLQLCRNDAMKNCHTVVLKPETRKYFFTSEGRLRAWCLLTNYSRIFDYISFRFYARTTPVSTKEKPAPLTEVLANIREFLAAKNTPVAVLVFPDLQARWDAPDSQPSTPLRRVVVEAVAASGMPYFLTETALPDPLPSYRMDRHDYIHPNRRAHELIGLAAVRFLIDENLVASETRGEGI